MSKRLVIKTLCCLLTTACIITIFAATSYAACSPGIPCTSYDIYSDPSSGRHINFNGPKGGGSPPTPPSALRGSDTACDGNFMNRIYARAHLEASRDVIMSEQIIHKPDSVLEYTCFDQLVGYASDGIGPIFTENAYMRQHDVEYRTGDNSGNMSPSPIINITTIDDDTLDDMLEPFLSDQLEEYIDSNFDHTFLGNAISLPPTPPPRISSSDMRNINYNCAHMAAIWHIAKCIDFAEDDRFRSFEHLASKDPRSIPKSCSPPGMTSNDTANNTDKLDGSISADIANPSGGISDPCPTGATPPPLTTGIDNETIQVANNCDLSSSEPNAYSSVDMMETHKELIIGIGQHIPGTGNSTGTIATCPSSPLPTGVPVIYRVKSPRFINADGISTISVTDFIYQEHFCPNPGCRYVPPLITPYIPTAPFPDLDTLPSTPACSPI